VIFREQMYPDSRLRKRHNSSSFTPVQFAEEPIFPTEITRRLPLKAQRDLSRVRFAGNGMPNTLLGLHFRLYFVMLRQPH
jgi:hypothetical protein